MAKSPQIPISFSDEDRKKLERLKTILGLKTLAQTIKAAINMALRGYDSR